MSALSYLARVLASSFLMAAMCAPSALAQPKVIASIQPIHSLVAGVMDGVATPELLVRATGSPHDYALRPSDAQRLRQAQLVFWVGESYETFLVKPLASLAGRSRVVQLDLEAGMTLLTQRKGGAWEDHGHDHGAKGKGRLAIDGHLFLDPANARLIVEAAVRALGDLDRANAGRYAANGTTVIARLDALDGELKAQLVPVAQKPFIVFHDAYQYFESRYALNAVGSIAADPERRPGAQQLRQIRRKIESAGAACVFSEPQFDAKLVGSIVADTRTRTGVLDPLGSGQQPGPDAYFETLRALAASLVQCLGAPRV